MGFERVLSSRLVAILLGVTAGTAPVVRGQGFPLWEATGPWAGVGLGASLSAIGDVDGDGLGDLLAGSPGAALVGGPASGQVRVLSGATGAVVLTLTGTQLSFGAAVAGVGDANGDGVRDILVGEPWAMFVPPLDATGIGRARLYSGANGAVLFTVGGTATMQLLGFSVAGVGDQNGDGFADVMIGVPGAGVPPTLPGQARIHSGLGGAVLLALTGTAPAQGFGGAVSGVGDLDADGVPDVVVGAAAADPSGMLDAGQARVFSGATGALLFAAGGASAADYLGASVAGPLDASGDGLADFLVGAPQGPGGAGYAILYSGASGAPLLTLNGSTNGDGFGSAVAWTGDVDGDGLSDIAVGAYTADVGALADAGRATVFSGTTGAPLLVFEGSQAGAAAGRSVTGIGDASGDGIPDLAVGAPGADPPGLANAGRVTVLSAVGLPSGTSTAGTGCAGSGGFFPGISTFGGPPEVGNAGFGVAVSRGLGGSLGLLFAAFAVDPAGVPLGGCPLHLVGLIFALPPAVTLYGPPGFPGIGYRLKGIGVPPDPALAGLAVSFQWAVLDGGSPNGLFTASPALSATIL